LYRKLCTGEPLKDSEIKAHADLYGFTFEGVEVDLLKSVDRAYMRVQMEELEAAAKAKPKVK
jgi:hypothetical protein